MVGGLYGGLRTQGLPRSSQILEATYRLALRPWTVCCFTASDVNRMRSGTTAGDPVSNNGANVLRLETAVVGTKFTALIDEGNGNPVRADFGGSDGERVLTFTSDTLVQTTGSDLATTEMYGVFVGGFTRTSGRQRIFHIRDAAATEQLWVETSAAGTCEVWYNVDAVTGLTKPTTDQLFVIEIDFHAGERRVTTHFVGGSFSQTAGTAYGTRNLATMRIGGFDSTFQESELLDFRFLALTGTRPSLADRADILANAKIIANV